MYTKKDLEKIDKTRLARWFDIFNKWGWPEDYIYPKPEGFDDFIYYDKSETNPYTRYGASRWHMDVIEEMIGKKECLRYHHLNNLKIKNYQFEVWWFFRNLNSFVRGIGFPNFEIDIYSFMGWRVIQ